jgi:hypothetical protein
MDAYIRRLGECLRSGFDERGLQVGRHWKPDSDVPVTVIVVGEYDIDLVVTKERPFAV